MTIKNQLVEIFKKHREEIDESTLTLDTNISELGIDSLDFVELIFDIESAFSIEFQDYQLAKLHTLDDFIQCIKNTKEEPQ